MKFKLSHYTSKIFSSAVYPRVIKMIRLLNEKVFDVILLCDLYACMFVFALKKCCKFAK